MKRFRHNLEAAALWVGLRTVPLLPRRLVLALSRGLGLVAYALARELRVVGLANLELAFGDSRSPEEKRRILKASFACFARTVLDLLWFSWRSRERLSRWVRIDDSSEPFFTDRPQICVTAHFGNWEILGQAVSLHGKPLLSVAAPLKNPKVDRMFHRMRIATGQCIIPREGALRRLLTDLRGHGKVGLLLDQNIRAHQGGIFIDFFGVPALVSEAGASLALRTGCEMLFGYCRPLKDGSYVVYMADRIEAVQPTRKVGQEQLRDLNQRIADLVEKEIRAHPECWLWAYKRWKYLAPDTPREQYPYYAKKDHRSNW